MSCKNLTVKFAFHSFQKADRKFRRRVTRVYLLEPFSKHLTKVCGHGTTGVISVLTMEFRVLECWIWV